MRAHRWALAGALSLSQVSCVAQIREEPLYGGIRTTPETRTEVVSERVDLPQGASECREVSVTSPLVRDTVIRRSFTDHAQIWDAALLALLVTGVGLLDYGANQTACPHGHCPDLATVNTAEYALLGIAAVPLGFLVFNAIRVQDGRTVAAVAPRMTAGEWHPCAGGAPGSASSAPSSTGTTPPSAIPPSPEPPVPEPSMSAPEGF